MGCVRSYAQHVAALCLSLVGALWHGHGGIYNNVQYQVVDTYFVTGIITRPTDMKKYVEVWKFWEVIAKGYVAPSTVQDGCLQNWFQQMFKEKCESTQKTSEHVWSSHTARVWTNRVELPILHMVS